MQGSEKWCRIVGWIGAIRIRGIIEEWRLYIESCNVESNQRITPIGSKMVRAKKVSESYELSLWHLVRGRVGVFNYGEYNK